MLLHQNSRFALAISSGHTCCNLSNDIQLFTPIALKGDTRGFQPGFDCCFPLLCRLTNRPSLGQGPEEKFHGHYSHWRPSIQQGSDGALFELDFGCQGGPKEGAFLLPSVKHVHRSYHFGRRVFNLGFLKLTA